MVEFSIYGSIGSFVVAGLCYAAYKSKQNTVKQLQEARSFQVGNALIEEVKKSPNQSLDYVAICGDAKALQSPIESSYAPKMQSVIQRVTLHEHKVEWLRTSRQWHNTRRTINTMINSVPFSLNSPNGRIKVTVNEPLAASGLDYNVIYDQYEPVNSSVSENIVQWASGEKTKGIQTVEDAILEGTTLTAVGRVKLENGSLTVGVPADTHTYFLSKLSLDGLARERKNSFRILKYVTIFFSVTGGMFLLYWLYKKWKRRNQEAVVFDEMPDEDGDLNLEEGANEQSCVICLTRRRNVVILDCGHICVCRVCAAQVDVCPICRSQIVRLVPTYRS